MTEQYTPPQPTAEHRRLSEHAGTWNVDCTFYMDPSQPPMKVKAKEKIEMFGQFWTTSVFEADMFGTPFKGRATLGYDPVAKQYVSTWIDTMSPQHFAFTGKFDKSGKVLEMRGQGVDCQSGQMASYRTTEKHVNAGERHFEMFMTPQGGPEVKLFTHKYTRAG